MVPRIFAVLAILLPAASTQAQIDPVPYDAGAVREAARTIQQVVAHPTGAEEELATPLVFIAASLETLKDVGSVPDEVIDALVLCAGTGGIASRAIARFGNRAVTRLETTARVAAVDRNEPRRFGSMSVLTTMLQRDDPDSPLTPESRASIRNLASSLLADRSLMFATLVSAARLALATEDERLRAQVLRLADPAELAARGIVGDSQSFALRQLRNALNEFKPR
jgi:hypothetical protein